MEQNGTGTVWEFPRHHPHLLPSEKVLVRKVATIIRITETEQGCLALDRSYAHLHVGPRSMAAYPISPVSGTRPARGSLHVRATNKPYRHITVPSHTRHRYISFSGSLPSRPRRPSSSGLTRANITSRPLRNR
jgi:hypothetical protein